MSPFDIARITGTGPIRPTTRERTDVSTPGGTAAAPIAADRSTAVRLETGAAVSTAEAPIDAERVALIRAALDRGSYPLVPARIADAMIAAPLLLATGA